MLWQLSAWGLGIEGVFGLFFTLILAFSGLVGGPESIGLCFSNCIYIIAFGGGNVAALILANKAEIYGDTSGMKKAAKITGLIGVIGHSVAFVLSVVFAMVACANL